MFPLRDDQPTFSTPFVTYFLIGVNILIQFFQWQLARTNPHAAHQFVAQFAMVPSAEAGSLVGNPVFAPIGAVLPIFTSMFLHGDWWHVLGNMWMLWIFGDNIEDYLGHFNYLVFYLTCGVAAALTHIAFNLNSKVPTIGASGAIAGVMGAYFILYPRARVLTVTWIIVPLFFYLPAWVWLGVWAVIQFIGGTNSFSAAQQGGIAFWAHVGGFVVGILLIKTFPERAQRRRYGAW